MVQKEIFFKHVTYPFITTLPAEQPSNHYEPKKATILFEFV